LAKNLVEKHLEVIYIYTYICVNKKVLWHADHV